MPAYTQVVLPDPSYLDTKSYAAKADRQWFQDFLTAGVVSGLAVTWTSGMGIQIAAGSCLILGQNVADQGIYREAKATNTTMTVPASNPSNPRLDQVIVRVLDNVSDGSTFEEARFEIIPGTPTSGATLANRLGAANLGTLLEASKSVLHIADILVPAAAVALSAGAIGDKRTYATLGGTIATVGEPTGTVKMYAGTAAPSGYVMCDGTLYDGTQSAYQALWGVVGTSFGGSGQNSFAVPDMRGRAPVGKGVHADHSSLGANEGLAVGSRRIRHTHATPTHQHTTPTHQHTVPDHVHTLPAHTHTTPTHTHTMGNHTHTMAHIHDLSNHTHTTTTGTQADPGGSPGSGYIVGAGGTYVSSGPSNNNSGAASVSTTSAPSNNSTPAGEGNGVSGPASDTTMPSSGATTTTAGQGGGTTPPGEGGGTSAVDGAAYLTLNFIIKL